MNKIEVNQKMDLMSFLETDHRKLLRANEVVRVSVQGAHPIRFESARSFRFHSAHLFRLDGAQHLLIS